MPLVDDILRAKLFGKKIPVNKNVDERLKFTNQATSILNSAIQFVPAKRPYEAESTLLKSKYIRLSSQKTNVSFSFNADIASCSTQPIASNMVDSGYGKQSVANGVPPPMFDIFPADRVRLNWDPKLRRSTAIGLHNLGNTCFLNSVLQVLTNTGPLVNYLLSDEHDDDACPKTTGFCALCLIKNHIQRVFNYGNGNAIAPNSVVSRVRCFMKSHSLGRQEDAHEFLRYFIDAMQTAALYSYRGKKLDLYTKETSVIGRIFGGYHKNEVTCNNCHYQSVTYDPFLDLSVEVKHCDSLEAALSHFTRVETLSSENAYKCPKCKLKVSAKKMFTIHQAPNVLTIQLKRFDHVGKIDRFIAYPERLSLRPYMTEKQGSPVNYRLYGLVVHQGRSTRSGHYYAFVRNPCDQWHLLDDSRAAPVAANQALRSHGAYLLFYIRAPLPVAAIKPQASIAPIIVQIPKRKQEPEPKPTLIPSGNEVEKKPKSESDDGESKLQIVPVPIEPEPEQKSSLNQLRKERKLKRKSERRRDNSEPRRKFNVVQQLQRYGQLGGYGFPVKSWAGSKSCMEKLSTDTDSGLGDDIRDEWNEEFDKGKAKKKKKKRGQMMCIGANPFQRAQNANNRNGKRKFIPF